MFAVLDINRSKICYHTHPCVWTSEYYKYCLHLLILSLQLIDQPINIILGTIDYNFRNTNRTLRLDIQSEHTLVKRGGRDVGEIVWGDVDLLDEEGKYLIRIPNYEYFSKLDATIEYSLPNMVNMSTNDKYSGYLETATYVAPVIYFSPDFQNRQGTATITMFSNNPCERRLEFSTRARDIVNIQGVFSKEDLRQVYHTSRVMVNVHQTDHHHTFEELRVLPALCNGVVIVSEDVPLKDKIPYADSIVWCSYEDLVETVEDVQHNYKLYFEKIFTSNLEEHIRQLHKDNIEGLTDLIRQIA